MEKRSSWTPDTLNRLNITCLALDTVTRTISYLPNPNHDCVTIIVSSRLFSPTQDVLGCHGWGCGLVEA